MFRELCWVRGAGIEAPQWKGRWEGKEPGGKGWVSTHTEAAKEGALMVSDAPLRVSDALQKLHSLDLGVPIKARLWALIYPGTGQL